MIERIDIAHLVSTLCTFCPDRAVYLIKRAEEEKTKILAFVCDHHNQLPDEAFTVDTNKERS